MKDRKSQLTKEYLEKYSDLSSRTLARKLANDYPMVFPTIENARNSVRYYNGTLGKESRLIASKTNNKKLLIPSALDKLLLEIEEPVDFDYKPIPYKLPKNIKKLGIINDIHIPLHDKEAMIAAYRYLKGINIDGLVINGDLFDFYWLSVHSKEYKHFSFKDELDMCRNELDRIRQIFGDIPIYFKEGNHEERWSMNLRNNAQALYGLDDFMLETLCRAEEYKMKWVRDKRLIEYGHLNIAHGHEFRAGIIAPVNIARTYFIKANTNLCVGHHHTTQEYTHKDITGTIKGCWAIGALCNLQPKYMPYNNWNHGFAYVEKESSGIFEFNNKKIINGKIK